MYQSNGSGRQSVVEPEEALLRTGRTTDRVRVLGHRGAPGPNAPENTVAAVTEALRRGADGVEIDVWLTTEGTLVCAHDLVDADEDAQPLTELLAAAQHPAGSQVVVEAKPVSDPLVARATAGALADVLGAAAGRADVTVSSFDPVLLAMIRRACADLPVRTALLGATSTPAAVVVRRAHGDGHDEVHLPLSEVRHTPEAVELARWLGLSVSLWTVNRRADVRWAAEIGVDAVITDDVHGARTELARAEARTLSGAVVVAAA